LKEKLTAGRPAAQLLNNFTGRLLLTRREKITSTAARRKSMTTGAAEKADNRISRLRAKMITPPEICIERGYWVTESYKETESEPYVIRRAKSLEKVLKHLTLGIDEGELIVGRPTSKQRAASLVPETYAGWLDELESIATREWDRFSPFTEDEKAKMQEFLPYWKGKTLREKWRALIPDKAKKLIHRVQEHVTEGGGPYGGHVAVDYERILKEGLTGFRKQVESELKKLDPSEIRDFEKLQFLQAVDITLAAAIDFSTRYSAYAGHLAQQEPDPQRKAELEKIAEICSKVPAGPAETFWEAIQSIYFIFLVLMIDSPLAGTSFGRPDQYLYPYYKKDLAEGRITREQARELIALLFVKVNGFPMVLSTEHARQGSGLSIQANITLGGITPEGKDAVNELSYLFLDAETEVGLIQEDIIIRVNKHTPEAFLMKACEVTRLLRGKLKFVSDDTIIQQLMSDGKPLEYARDYIITGCWSPTVPARSFDHPGGIFNLPLMLELALNNGVSRQSHDQIGPQTGDPSQFKSYEEVWQAYTRQVASLMPVAILYKNVGHILAAQYAPNPFLSALFRGCLEKGLDITNGGTAPYISYATELGGAPNVGDSLAAIKKVVFEDKKITMERLIDALDKDFAGEDEVRHLLNSAPKFGNDDDYVDSIVNQVLLQAAGEITKYRDYAGAVSNAGAATVTANVPMGYSVGALPDGRKAGEPISEGGVSPHQGRNINGPTATMKSVAKLDLAKLTNGSVLNMRFSPDALKDATKMRKFAILIRTFLETGGQLVQFNIVSTEVLRDAQKHPEKYRDLLVRVATYSSYFVELSPELQNDIIARTEFDEI
jgi:choline trimethylamine-lyase